MQNKRIYLSDNYLFQYYGELIIATSKINGMELRMNRVDSLIIESVNQYVDVQLIINNAIRGLNISEEKQNLIEESVKIQIKKLCDSGILDDKNNHNCSILKNKIYGDKGLFYPGYINIELTNACNFKCEHCYKEAGIKNDYLDFRSIMLLKEIFKNKTPLIQLSGGEPFLYPQITQLINELSDCFKISIVSNGSRISVVDVEVLKKINNLQISLYGTNEKEYYTFTNNLNGFKLLQEGCNHLKKNNIPFTCAVTVNKNNINKIDEICQTAYVLGAKELRFGLGSLVGRLKKERLNYIFDNSTVRMIYRNIRRQQEKYKGKMNIELWNEKNKKDFNFDIKISDGLSCGAGCRSIVVSEKGIIRPCEFLPDKYFSLGDLNQYKEFIYGKKKCNFIKEMKQFNEELSKENVSFGDICEPLDNYYKLINMKESNEI